MNAHLTTDFLIDYLHGELPAEDDAFVHAHLATCETCRAELAAETALSEALASDPLFEERELPGAVRGAIWAKVDTERPSLAMRFAAFLKPVVAVPVATAAIALAVIASPFGHAGSGPRVDAAYYLEAHAAQQAENPFAERAPTAVLETSMLDSAPAAAPATLADAEGTAALDIVR